MLVWQFMHERASVMPMPLEVELFEPPVTPATPPRWLVGSWQLLAEERRAHLEQVVVHGAVRVVADRAVLLHRLVGAHERPALLHVARVAGVVDAVAHQRFLARRAVRVVAVRADDLAFERRVARLAADLGALLLVAG